MERIDSMAG